MTDLTRRTFTAALAASTAAVSTAWPVLAQAPATWPEKPIKMVIPFPPGGGTDFLARLLGQKMGESLKQAIVVENKPGAATTIAADIVAKSAPDGYSLLMMLRDMSINPSLMPDLPFDTLKSFSWIGKVGDSPFVLVVNPSVQAKSVSELVELAKAKPGVLSYGSLAVGGLAHVCMEAMSQHLGIKLLHVPYKGAGPALQAAITGEITMTLAALTGAIPFIREGKLRALAVGATTRAPQLPDVPTIGEAGGGAETILPQYYGLAAPAGTPAPVIERISAELKKALELPDVAEKLVQNGIFPAFSTAAELRQLIATDIERFAKIVKTVDIKLQ